VAIVVGVCLQAHKESRNLHKYAIAVKLAGAHE
jgi:hypothetical protein